MITHINNYNMLLVKMLAHSSLDNFVNWIRLKDNI